MRMLSLFPMVCTCVTFRNILTLCGAELLAPHLTLPSWRITLCHPSLTWARTMPWLLRDSVKWRAANYEHLVVLPSVQGCRDVTPCHCVVCSDVSTEHCALIFKGSLWRLIAWTRRRYVPFNVGTQWRSAVLQRPQTSKSNKFNLYSFNIHHYGCHTVIQCICQERGPETTQLTLSVWPNCNGINVEHY